MLASSATHRSAAKVLSITDGAHPLPEGMRTPAARQDRDDRVASAHALSARRAESEYELFDIGLATIGLQVIPCMLLGRATGAGTAPAVETTSPRGGDGPLGKSTALLHLGFIGAGIFAAGLLQVAALGGSWWIALAMMTGGGVLTVTSWRSARMLLDGAYPAEDSAAGDERPAGAPRVEAFEVDRVGVHGAE